MRVDPDPPRRRMRSRDDPPSCRDSVRRLVRAPEPKHAASAAWVEPSAVPADGLAAVAAVLAPAS